MSILRSNIRSTYQIGIAKQNFPSANRINISRLNIASVDQISISRSNVQSADIIIGTVISEFKNLDKTQLDASIFFVTHQSY